MCELTNQWRALKRQELQQSIFWQRGEYSAAFWALKHVNLFSSNTKKIDKPENEHSMSLLTSHFEVHSLNLFNETSNIWMYVGCTLTQAFHLYQGPSAHTSPALYRKLLSVSLDTAESESTSSGQGLWFLKKRGTNASAWKAQDQNVQVQYCLAVLSAPQKEKWSIWQYHTKLYHSLLRFNWLINSKSWQFQE